MHASRLQGDSVDFATDDPCKPSLYRRIRQWSIETFKLHASTLLVPILTTASSMRTEKRFASYKFLLVSHEPLPSTYLFPIVHPSRALFYPDTSHPLPIRKQRVAASHLYPEAALTP